VAIVPAVECQIITCERVVFTGAVDAVYARSREGWFGVLAGHAPAAMSLADGPVRVIQGGQERKFHLVGATLIVFPKKVTLLAERLGV